MGNVGKTFIELFYFRVVVPGLDLTFGHIRLSVVRLATARWNDFY